jgi:hypothetical protein
MVMMKFSIGDVVKFKEDKEFYTIVAWNSECTIDNSGKYVTSFYVLKENKTGMMIDFVDEEEIKLVKPSSKLVKKDIDDMLDKYNEYIDIHNLLVSLGIDDDDEYKNKALEIIHYLKLYTTKD